MQRAPEGGHGGADPTDGGADHDPAGKSAPDEGPVGSGATHTAQAAPTAERVGALQAEVAQWRDQAMRARADYANLQRRIERDALVERERVRARVLENFLEVYEYGRLAVAEAEKHPGPLAQGVQIVVKEFERLLELEGVVRIGEAGEAFDPRRHEAVGEEAVRGVEAGRVSRVVAPGYLLGERVLRYAKVTVQPGPHGLPSQPQPS